jgi:polar amino acid transport system substrate-binding protein
MPKIVSEALITEGYKIQYKSYPWSRALDMTRNGEADGIIGTNTAECNKIGLIPSAKVFSMHLGFLYLKESGIKYKGISDLKPYNIGLYTNAYESIMKKIGLKYEIVQTSLDANIKKLIAKRVDLVFCNKEPALYLLKSNSSKVGFIPYSSNEVLIGFPKSRLNSKTLSEDYKKGLNNLIKNGAYNKILQKYGFNTN